MGEKYDFSGWATVNDRECTDGRTIKPGAFAHQDGAIVPLIWQHQHDAPQHVLGHALLKNEPKGVRCFGSFNSTEDGLLAKELVHHGDITRLSINANHLHQRGGDVLHGNIKEVSLVLGGANPEAFIDIPVIAHGDGEYVDGDEGTIYMNEAIEIMHYDEVSQEEDPKELEHADEPNEKEKTMAEDAKERTVQDVLDEMTDEQKNVVYYMIGQALEDAGVATEDDGEAEHSDDDFIEGEDEMKHNAFDAETMQPNYLTHADMEQIFKDAKRTGSLKDAVNEFTEANELFHDDEPERYGIMVDPNRQSSTYGIDYLFPDYKELNSPPEFINHRTEWVSKVMNSVHHTPFSRIKTSYADITGDEARALGYIKGNRKKEEVFTLLKRTTDPQTIYKKQKLDRDDIVDITDFDVVAWIKAEMRGKLDEELARAFLIGDGRSTASEDHIFENHIRPIWKEDSLFAVNVTVTNSGDDEANAKNIIDAVIKARKNYRGSGNPTYYTTEDIVSDMLLLEDGIGHKLYKSEAELATVLRVKEIVTVPPMENKTRDGKKLLGIIVNLQDYNVGADKGGAINMFDDFDIDYNQQKYLIETRCSGALVKPYSALVLELAPSGATGATGATGTTGA